MNVKLRVFWSSVCIVMLTSVSLLGQGFPVFESTGMDAENYRGRLSLGRMKKVPYYRTSPLNKKK